MCTWLIAYRLILHVPRTSLLTSASSPPQIRTNHPLQAWINYDVKICTKAASNPSLRWDIQYLDLWLERFLDTAAQPNHRPCNHCGSTTHYPNHCPFRSSPTHTHGGGQSPYGEDHQLMEVDQ